MTPSGSICSNNYGFRNDAFHAQLIELKEDQKNAGKQNLRWFLSSMSCSKRAYILGEKIFCLKTDQILKRQETSRYTVFLAIGKTSCSKREYLGRSIVVGEPRPRPKLNEAI